MTSTSSVSLIMYQMLPTPKKFSLSQSFDVQTVFKDTSKAYFCYCDLEKVILPNLKLRIVLLMDVL